MLSVSHAVDVTQHLVRLIPSVSTFMAARSLWGHPFGATGARMVTTMANELKLRDEQFALLGICAAGGLGASAILEHI